MLHFPATFSFSSSHPSFTSSHSFILLWLQSFLLPLLQSVKDFLTAKCSRFFSVLLSDFNVADDIFEALFFLGFFDNTLPRFSSYFPEQFLLSLWVLLLALKCWHSFRTLYSAFYSYLYSLLGNLNHFCNFNSHLYAWFSSLSPLTFSCKLQTLKSTDYKRSLRCPTGNFNSQDPKGIYYYPPQIAPSSA